MATYTDNYSLTKPTFAEVADIRTINGNMDTIDDIMHASQVSLADAYDQTATYNTGDVVMYEFLMYKCKEDNVTGNWDAMKWERTTAAKTGGGEVDFDLYGEASGNPASFVDGSASALVECETEIVPVQDLHGYDKPWIGGAGKNLFSGANALDGLSDNNGLFTNTSTDTRSNLQLKALFYNGSTIVDSSPNLDVTSAGRVSISRTISSTITKIRLKHNGSQRDLYLEFPFDKQGAYTISLNVIGYDPTTIGGISFDDVMIESGSSMTTYEPYSNICPISGHSSVTINVSPTSEPTEGVDTTIQLGQTVYGGQLNVLTGELKITKRIITENDFTMMGGGTSGGGLNYFQIPSTDPQATSTNAISNMLEQNQSGWSSTTPCFSTNTGASPNIYPVRVYAKSTSLANLKTEYSGLQIVYTLAISQTVQLTPAQVASVLGQNYVSSDTGAVDVIYIKTAAPIIPNATGDSSGDLNSIGLGGKIFTIPKELPAPPAADGAYKLRVTVTDGAPTFSWVSDT